MGVDGSKKVISGDVLVLGGVLGGLRRTLYWHQCSRTADGATRLMSDLPVAIACLSSHFSTSGSSWVLALVGFAGVRARD